MGWVWLNVLVAVGCSAANSPSSASGGQGNGAGHSNGGAGGGSSGITGGTTGVGMGGATSTGGTGIGTAGGTVGGTTGVGTMGGATSTVPQGGTTGTAGAGAGGNTMVTCSNTDKTILPIDSTGWIDKSCDACGVQGAFYWYGDTNTAATLKCNGALCVKDKAPYQMAAPGPGMCISGTATGSSKDWGAGIGLSLADSGGMNSVKGAFNAAQAACGNITGFDITLTGNTNGMPVRIGFATSADGSTISPFIPAGDPAGTTLALSGSSQIVIKNAAIPADWKSMDPSPPDPSKIYDLQIQVAADQAKAGQSFDLCVTGIKPVVEGGGSGGSGGGGGGTGCKANSVGTVSANTGLQGLGPNYGYQNNVNNLGSGSQSVTGYYGSTCAALSVMTSGISSNNNAPASYPSIVDGWHWGNWAGSYTKGNAKAVSALTSVTSSWAFTPPAGPKWDVAYDMWVAQSTGISAPDGNTLEVMVWLDYSTASTTNPIGDKLTSSVMVAGTSWEIWYGATGSWHTVTYRRTPGTGPVTNLDLLTFLKDAVTRGTGATSWNLLSVQAGFELFNATSGGSIDSYSATIN